MLRDSTLLRKVLFAFSQNKIRYCIAHGAEYIESNIDSDVDLFINPSDLCRVKEILQDFGLFQVIQHGSEACLFVLADKYSSEEKPFLQLDMYIDFRQKGWLVFSNEEIFENVKQNADGYMVLAAEMEFVYYFIKRLGKLDFSSKNIDHLLSLYSKNPIGCTNHLLRFFTNEEVDEIVSLIHNYRDNNSFIEVNQNIFSRLHKINRIDYFLYRVREIIRSIKRIITPTGLFISLLGVDGSGKSTIISKIVEDHTLLGFRASKKFHFRPNILFKGKKSNSENENPHKSSPYPVIGSFIKSWIIYFDWIIGLLFSVLPLKIKSTLVIYDRHFSDILLDPLRYRINCPKSILKLISYLLPYPEIIFVIDVSSEIAITRKNELTIRELSSLVPLYSSFSGKNVVHINGNQNVNAICADIENHVIEYMRRRISRNM